MSEALYEFEQLGDLHLYYTDFARILEFEADERWQAMLRGLDQLHDAELTRLLGACMKPEEAGLLTDSCNYDPTTDRWCALAVAIDLPHMIQEHNISVTSNREGRDVLTEFGELTRPGFTTNPISGIRGEALTSDRLNDLRRAVASLRIFRLSFGCRPQDRWGASECAQLSEAVAAIRGIKTSGA